ncbi:metallophosphoesterase family protein [Candidatus Kuenenbacteria bacterium]|nr:metallophosphoesterase family protein [Candidatus Kuenenbacteria bacterium]
MKIAIISDLHDNLVNLEKFLAWAKANNIEELFVLGDLCAAATLKRVLAPGFIGHIHIVFGNVCDRENELAVAKTFPHVTHSGDLAELIIDNKKIALTHYPQKAKELATTEKNDFVFYGHTHKPWIEQIGSTTLANPGTLAGMFSKATFAVWDTTTGKLELKILELL